MPNVTVRYYRINTDGAVKFEDALDSLRVKSVEDREVNIGDGEVLPVFVRLEDLDKAIKPYVSGEFVRRILSGNPPEATKTGLKELSIPEESGLGYQVAFAYHPKLRVLALEHKPHDLSAGRIILYVNMATHGGFEKVPIVAQPAWERYQKSKPRKLQITIANPENLGAVEGEASGVLSTSARLREIFDAPVITIEVSMGHKKGWLNMDRVSKAIEYFTKGDGKTADVRSLKASVRTDEGDELESLDFLQEMLVSKESLELHSDPAKNYEIRKSFVRLELAKNLPYIQKVFGDQNA